MLNRAHWLHRQAEKATRKGNVEEAVRYHKEAADILNDLLQNIIDEKVAESLRLQAQLHEKERTILRHQRKKAEKVYRESVIRNMSEKEAGQTGHLLDQLKLYDEAGLTSAASSRLTGRSFNAVPSDYLACGDPNQDVLVGVATKKPKDDKVIIEELQVANSHLRKMVDSLFHELSTCQRENLELRARIRQLESMQPPSSQGLSGVGGGSILSVSPKPSSIQSQSAQPSPRLGFRTFKPENNATPSKSAPPPPATPARSVTSTTPQPQSSPATQSITGESSIASSECQLPPLPPLEMPTFDFDKRSEA